jgi:hypothetical protein
MAEEETEEEAETGEICPGAEERAACSATVAEVDTCPDAVYGFELALKRDYQLFIFALRLPLIEGPLLYDLICKATAALGGETDNFGVITVDELEMSLDGATEFAVTFDRFRRNFFVERNGENILYGHFDMDPLYDAADPISRFVPFGAAAGLRIDPVTVTTPWCDRLTTSPP